MEADLTSHRIEGYAVHGGAEFSVPLISHISGNLFVGGCIAGVPLPLNIEHVVSLYPWESYLTTEDVVSVMAVRLFDSTDLPDEQLLWAIAAHAHRMCALGPTLVHCQAGLNRSNLIAALALILHGMTGTEAIDLLRAKRSPAVLCNESFEAFILGVGEAPAL